MKNKKTINQNLQTIINLKRFLEGHIKLKKNISNSKTKGKLAKKFELPNPNRPKRNRVLSVDHKSDKLLLSSSDIDY